MDFAALPPEINSARIYAGPGATPMLAAAAAWHDLAAELHSAAASYASVLSGLIDGPWQGPASMAMTSATTPYVAWMSATAARAAQAGAQAGAAAAAYEAAFAMTVPPPVIAANRALLMTLIATNIVGQNTPAIAATEAHYGEMWAQDAAAMHGYAGASVAAATLTPFTPPPAEHPVYYLLDVVADVGVLVAAASSVLSSSMATIGATSGLANGAALAASAPAAAALEGLRSGAGRSAGVPSAVLGRAASIGRLSVPPGWAAPAASPAAPASGGTPVTAAPRSGAPGIPGMPMTGPGANANGNGNAVPKYGFRPTVVVRTPAAG